MRELKPTLRNGDGQSREPPLHHIENQKNSQFLTESNPYIKNFKKWRPETISKNGAESEKLTSRKTII